MYCEGSFFILDGNALHVIFIQMAMKKILLVDDDEDDREFVLEVMSSNFPDVHCVTAVNGKDAFEKLVQYRPDVILLDLNMPLMNGREFLERIKKTENLKNIPVIILSTSSDKGTIEHAHRLGALDFITKPDMFSGWESRLAKILRDPALFSKS